jgi:hypothetical protein
MQTRTLACRCEHLTGWALVGTAARPLFQLGVASGVLGALAVGAAARRIRAAPAAAAAIMGVTATAAIVGHLETLAGATVFAVWADASLVYAPGASQQHQLSRPELVLIASLLRPGNAVCPIACPCTSRACFSGVPFT